MENINLEKEVILFFKEKYEVFVFSQRSKMYEALTWVEIIMLLHLRQFRKTKKIIFFNIIGIISPIVFIPSSPQRNLQSCN